MTMKNSILLILIYLVTASSCASRRVMIPNEANTIEIAVNKAISDFADSCYLFDQDSVFHVSDEDTLRYWTYRPGQGKMMERVCDSIYTDLLGVVIFGSVNKITYFSDATIGSKGKLPSRYAIVRGKLFYWDDDSYPFTEEMLYVLTRYNVLTSVVYRNNPMMVSVTIDDSKKAADYFFCKKNPAKYVRVITNVALGYYKPPTIDCTY